MKFGVGQPVRRVEDQTLITGKGRYTDDITLPNMAQAYVLRARVAHANIRKIDASAAKAHAWRAAGADRRGREGRRARQCAVPCAAQQPGRLPASRHAAPCARHRQSASSRPAGRTRHRRDLAAGAGCGRSDRDRLRGAARRRPMRAPRWRRARRSCSTAFPATRVRLGQRHLGLRRDRCRLRQGRARHHARDRQQPPRLQFDGAAQRDRRLGRGGRTGRCSTPARKARISCAIRSPRPC